MRKASSFLAKFAVSALVLYLALNWVSLGTVASRFAQIDPRWVTAGLLVPVVQNFFLAVRWQALISACGADLPVRQLFRFSMVALFFNQTLPSSVGGDAMRIWLLGKEANWRTAAYSVFIDRVVGVVALAIIVTACLPWTLRLVQDPIGRSALLAIGLGCIAAGVMFVSLAWGRLTLLQRWAPTRHLAAVARVALDILCSPRPLAWIFVNSIIIHLLTAISAWIAARAVGVEMPFLYAIFLVLPVILIAVVPVSVAGWGVREGAMAAAFGYAGLAPGDGLIVSLLYGATYLASGIIGGGVWILSGQKTKDEAMPAAQPLD
ncbi:MAG TPA: lysylphosphatidylglycerol synthase transmembrane domain-containing protein [Pseudolabrys sp.]|nr:lysylphosphatidylglycerol synthase transmembrane domain-containing protein [Pseudolabrys sp.]